MDKERLQVILEKLLDNKELINSAQKGEIVINFSDTAVAASIKIHV